MDNMRREVVERLFQKLADLPRPQRITFLNEHSKPDPEIRQEVELMLDRLDNPIMRSLRAADLVDEADGAEIGEQIGPYKILEVIGEGGFGVVYMAQQETPVRRNVALKIIKLGMDTKQVVARFEGERQALAMMEHPNIATVFDGGVTGTGRPYFVMELVKGVPVTRYCDKNRLSTRQRLELFIGVCRAAQHAHQKGIIHRDIKPSNVLVASHDGIPVPKIIDFGIAKAMHEPLTDKTVFTSSRQFMGTPEYVSPEQAEMGRLDVDTRSDVYSLGVLLYELLTGTTPLDSKRLHDATYSEILHTIREQTPVTPSRRLNTLGSELPNIASARRVAPHALGKLIFGDLDWIVMKALEKDRARRYTTVAAFAEDLGHHLNSEPVLARPPSPSYRLHTFARRNKVAVVAGCLVATAVLLGLTLATIGLVRAERERDRALAAELRAQQEAGKANREAETAAAINAFFNDLLASTDPMQLQLLSAFAPDYRVMPAGTGGFARDVSVAEMMRSASARMGEAFAGKPELEATARETIGMTLRGLGLYADARPQLQTALDIRRRTLGADHPDTLRSASLLGDLILDMGKSAEAEPLVRSALTGMQRVYGEDHPRTLSCASVLAVVLSDQCRHAEATPIFERTLKAQRRVLGSEHRDTLTTMRKWSVAYLARSMQAEGQPLARELYETSRRTLSPDDSLNVLAGSLMGWWHVLELRYNQAESLLRPGLLACRRILGEQHPFTYLTMQGLGRSIQGKGVQAEKEQLYRAALVGLRMTRGRGHWQTLSAATDLARWLEHRGRLEEAEEQYRTLVTDCTSAFGEQDFYPLGTQMWLAGLLERRGRFDEAAAVLRRRKATLRESLGYGSLYHGGAMLHLAQTLLRAGKVEDARNVTRELISMIREFKEEDSDNPDALRRFANILLIGVPTDIRDIPMALQTAKEAAELSGGSDATVLNILARAHHEAGDSGEAAEIQRRAVANLPEGSPYHPTYSARLAEYLSNSGDTAGAEHAASKVIVVSRAALGGNELLLAERLRIGGLRLFDDGYYFGAERLFLEALELYRRLLGEEHEYVAYTYGYLAKLYHDQGNYERAEQTYRAALAIWRNTVDDEDLRVPNTLHSLANVLHMRSDTAGATQALHESLAVYEAVASAEIPAIVDIKCALAAALTDLDQLDEAEPLATETLTTALELYGQQHEISAQAMHTMGMLLTKQGKAEAARPTLRRCVQILGELDLPEHLTWRLALAENTLGQCLTVIGRLDDAEALLTRSCASLTGSTFAPRHAQELAVTRLFQFYEALGDQERAAIWRRKLPLHHDK